MPIFTTVTCVLTYIISYGFSPKGYRITGDELIILRPFSNKHISRAEIAGVQKVDRKDLSGSLRLMGVGGLFGYYGRFSNFKIGNMTWYNTRRDKGILIQLKNNKKIVITPDDPDQFLNDFSD